MSQGMPGAGGSPWRCNVALGSPPVWWWCGRQRTRRGCFTASPGRAKLWFQQHYRNTSSRTEASKEQHCPRNISNGREGEEEERKTPCLCKLKSFFLRLKTRFLFKILGNQPLTSTENKAPLCTGETEPTALHEAHKEPVFLAHGFSSRLTQGLGASGAAPARCPAPCCQESTRKQHFAPLHRC